MRETTFLMEFEPSEIVYLKTDPEQQERMVIYVDFSTIINEPVYAIGCGSTESKHYGFELSKEKSVEYL